jgi:hypothetical protein
VRCLERWALTTEVGGERDLFIGTQFSNLYIAVDTPDRGRVVGKDHDV